ncbi:bifunctional glycosyltransferase family 2/GtrA family protein [Paenibacillus sp. 1001270B_150601_E10]|uniref:bifunctional glycosyltransferase family 2/GtrA family protein n=1 Tax=Paenibacillus sp. 1001270B_150601_E10 TaxID=2787079 RepID=UPI00189F5BD9|nr:bifunctional glycosyltransferase family 2/GtrA family protein [Paenibacillus sp. 1001270B_150601_E10]
MAILIPSYEPNERLLHLIAELQERTHERIIIVDDGSGEKYSTLFRLAKDSGCIVLTHVTNQGKGRALKTGFSYLREQGDLSGVVCADSDGQHQADDIVRVAEAIQQYPGHLILGSRAFTGTIPLRSRLGNRLTQRLFSFATGVTIRDTQTGLRGIPSTMLDWLCHIPGNRFEYEMNMLVQAYEDRIPIHEVYIETIYMENNRSSHFRPIRDSARVYWPFLKFGSSAITAAILDTVMLLYLQYITSNLFVSVIAARILSSVYNFMMNRHFVFARGTDTAVRQSFSRYAALAVLILCLNYGFIYVYYERLGIPLLVAKLMTEASLLIFSYWMQRKYVFRAQQH